MIDNNVGKLPECYLCNKEFANDDMEIHMRLAHDKVVTPEIFGGKPPESMEECFNGDVRWQCECGVVGISSSFTWARSDVNRHRRTH